MFSKNDFYRAVYETKTDKGVKRFSCWENLRYFKWCLM
ncbi:MAG: hypothetical protein ACP5QK_09645 [Myxococcota bacterium]